MYAPKIIQTKLINQYHNNFFVDYFDVNKTKELIDQKYYLPSLRKNDKAYIKGYNISLSLKIIRLKPYGHL